MKTEGQTIQSDLGFETQLERGKLIGLPVTAFQEQKPAATGSSETSAASAQTTKASRSTRRRKKKQTKAQDTSAADRQGLNGYIMVNAGQSQNNKSLASGAAVKQKSAQSNGSLDIVRPPKSAKKHLAPNRVTGFPPNDDCANAIDVTPANCSFTDTQDTTSATDQVGEPASTCTTQNNSVWYSYTNTTSNDVEVTVATCTSSFDTAIEVWEQTGASCDFASFVNVACNDDFCGDGFQSSASFTAAPGKTYKIQVGGFAGATGNLTTTINCQVFNCPTNTIHGTLGSGSPDHAFTTGNQTGRLNRNGISSSCATPKACNIFTAAGARAFDAYTFPNTSGVDACALVQLDVTTLAGANYQVNAYLDSFDPANICTNYLADPGLSSGGGPQAPTTMSFVVPSGHSVVLVVHTVNPGETGGNYTLTVRGNLCLSVPRYWTSAGSTGTTDEDSASIIRFEDFAATLKAGATGTATVRYNITAVRGITRFCPATQSTVNVRFRNSDNTGANSQVKFEIHRTSILSGGNDIIYSFNSNGLGAGSAFTTVSASPAIDFDFSNYIYWIEGTVYRNNTALFADLGAIEIYESQGTNPCP